MSPYVVGFQEIDKTKLMFVGVKTRTWGNYPGLVENATKLIKDGQGIRVHGTVGYVEIL